MIDGQSLSLLLLLGWLVWLCVPYRAKSIRVMLNVTYMDSDGIWRFYPITLVADRRISVENITLSVGHTVSFSILYLDQNGNPMLVAPVPDSPPVWSDSTPATGTLVVAANGQSAVETALAAGGDTVSLTVLVGGKSFAASVGLTVAAAPQVLSTVAIASIVN
jgi:hypothetical protein